jgi:hypothetical protein
MNNTTPTRKHAIVLLCAIVSVSLLYQIVEGWDTGQFLLRALGSAVFAYLMWRCGGLIAQGYAGAGRRLALHTVLWVAVAVALFLGFRMSA